MPPDRSSKHDFTIVNTPPLKAIKSDGLVTNTLQVKMAKPETLVVTNPPQRSGKLYRMTDFRRELAYREKKVAEIKREKMRTLADVKSVPRFMVTIDLSQARGNLDALKMCLRELEWKEYPFGRKDQHCDIHWHCVNFEQNIDLYGGQVNKFPGMNWICSKMNVFRVLDQMRNLYPEEYDFYPRTWYLPEQINQLACDIRKMTDRKIKPRPTFIIKPDEGSQGEGIYLLREPQDYMHQNGKTHVCQQYLNNVFTIDKFKFDLRVYVVLKSIDPLEFYVCNEGLARFSTIPYEHPTNRNLHETYMHLTNYSLNKKSSTFNRSERDDEGSKRSMSSVFSRLGRMGYNADSIWHRIEKLIAKTLIALIPDLKIEMQAAVPPQKPGPSCFQILGFDILLLHNLRPMLLEINGSPSLRIDAEVEVSPGVTDYIPSLKDEAVKLPLIRDTLLLVAPRSKIKYIQSLKRRRVRREKRRLQREAAEHRQREIELNRLPTQTELDGVIHVETNHPRSSIIIIRSTEDEKKQSNEIPFLSGIDSYTYKTHDFGESTGEENNELNETSEQSENLYAIPENCDETEDCVNDRNNNNIEEDSGMIPSYRSHKTLDDEQENEHKFNDVEGRDNEHESENSDDEKTDVYEARESCLKQLYPQPFEKKYDHLRLYEKLADVFMACLGIRATQRLGPTGFRTFARKCRLRDKGISNAAIDILYIDMQRKWEHVNPDRTTGLGFRGFLDACHEISRRKFNTGDKLSTMAEFIHYCEQNLLEEQKVQTRTLPKLPLRRQARPHGFPRLAPMPRTPCLELSEETPEPTPNQDPKVYIHPRSADDVDRFLRRHGQLKPVKRLHQGQRLKFRNGAEA